MKHNFLVKDVRDLAATIKGLLPCPFRPTRTGAGGTSPRMCPTPACAFSIQNHRDALLQSGHPRVTRADQEGTATAARRQAPHDLQRRRVVLGNAAEKLVKLTRMLGFPITNTLMGLGGYPPAIASIWACRACTAPKANMSMQYSDVLIAIGARFDDRVIGNRAISPPSRARSSTSISTLRRFPSGCGRHPDRRQRCRRARRNDQAARSQSGPPQPEALGIWVESRSRNGVAATA